MTLRGTQIATDKNVERVKAAAQRLNMLKAAGSTRKYLPSARLISICRTYVYPLADYSTNLVPLHTADGVELVESLEKLDYKVAEYCLGCIAKEPPRKRNAAGRIAGRLPRHLKMAKLPDWLQRIRMKIQSLKQRLCSRRKKCQEDAKEMVDPLHLVCLRGRIRSPKCMTNKDVAKEWKVLCSKRKIPIPGKGLVPVLTETNHKVRDAGIKWYTGSFPGDPDMIITVLGEEFYKRHKSIIDHGMQLDTWSTLERNNITKSIKVLLDAVEKYWEIGVKKRRVKRLEEDDEEWIPRKFHRSSK